MTEYYSIQTNMNQKAELRLARNKKIIESDRSAESSFC
nr:MAG TPA: hypothetical protein [Caudoviricetes sp.]